MQSTIHFFGGAGLVTGSNFLLDTGGSKILVDCGLFQGSSEVEENNWKEFSFNPKEITHLVVTHAHMDHIGRIPLLVKRGFTGQILSTRATKAIALPLLVDAMGLTTQSAKHRNKPPLYVLKDIELAMKQWKATDYHKEISLSDGVKVEFLNSGHILGSAMAKFTRAEKRIVFTGDLGGGNSPLLAAAEDLPEVEYLVMESVYGDRLQPEKDHRREALEDVIENSSKRKGTLLIPAFSNERTQDILFEIRTLMLEKRVPLQPVIVDSPLAKKITDAFLKYPAYFSDHIRPLVEAGENIFTFPEMHFVSTVAESRKADAIRSPKIIIAGSGMSNGGRVREHEKHILPDPESTLLIVGYQSAGSIGRRIAEGAKEVVIMHEKVPVRCRVEAIYSYSAHMDSDQLLEFVNKGSRSLKEVFVVMGEPLAATTLVQRIRDFLGVRATAPEMGEKVTIEL